MTATESETLVRNAFRCAGTGSGIAVGGLVPSHNAAVAAEMFRAATQTDPRCVTAGCGECDSKRFCTDEKLTENNDLIRGIEKRLFTIAGLVVV